MDKIALALVGCGGMGTRHLRGLKELGDSGLGNVELVALCDIRRENAELCADEAEARFGRRPAIYNDLATMAQALPNLDAVDIATEANSHHALACLAMELGLHVMVEKPMAITVRACLRMMEYADRYKRKLSVAENYRRSPVNRLVRYLLDRGAIGRPYLMTHSYVGGGNNIFITPWRHLKDKGGVMLDLGVHFADIIQYHLGEFEEVYGRAELVEKVRYKPDHAGWQLKFYQQRLAQMPDSIEATAEDTSTAIFKMKSGASVDWAFSVAGWGDYSKVAIYGTEGSIDFGAGQGGLPRLRLANSDKEWAGQEIVALFPDFALDDTTSRLFLGPRTVQHDLPHTEVDAKLLAIEFHDFATAVLADKQPEVDGLAGMKAVAAIYGILESSVLGTVVRMADVEAGRITAYQKEIDGALEL